MAENVDVVVVGGGIFGCSTAYYYSRDNPGKKIVVLERRELCNAATTRAAALLTRVRAKEHFIPLSLETYRVVPEMEALLGERLDVKYVGVIHVAASETTARDLDHLIGVARRFGLPAEYISNEEAHRRAPWLQTAQAIRIGFMEGEAYCDPYLLGTFFARCAKKRGADIRQGVAVNDLIMDGNTVVGVSTDTGDIYAGKVIVATGAWAPLLARSAGVALPMAPVRSQYWITEKENIFPVDSPIVLLPDVQTYCRPEGGSLLFGIRERQSLAVSPQRIPEDLTALSLSGDRGTADLSEVIAGVARFFPAVYDVGLKYYIAGLSGYTPDNNLSMGVADGVNNLLLATGDAGAGISVSGGVGLAFAQLAAGRPNPFDFSHFRLDRFGAIDPFSAEWLERCALARSKKVSG